MHIPRPISDKVAIVTTTTQIMCIQGRNVVIWGHAHSQGWPIKTTQEVRGAGSAGAMHIHKSAHNPYQVRLLPHNAKEVLIC